MSYPFCFSLFSQVAELPFPYTDPRQYEADMAQPLGKDFNARLAFEDLKRPDVKVQVGAYLKPAQYVESKERKTKSEKKAQRIPKNLQVGGGKIRAAIK